MPYGDQGSGGGGGLSSIAAYSALVNNTGSSAVPTAVQYPVLGTPLFTASGNFLQITQSVAGFGQLCLQNSSSSSSASTDVVVTADDGTDSAHYGDFGINSSTGGSAPFTAAHGVYLYSVDAEVDIGALGTSGTVKIYTGGGTSSPTLCATFVAAGLTMVGNITAVNGTFSGPSTFSAAGATAVPGLSVTGTPLTSLATGTAQVLIQPTGTTAISTLSASGTMLAINCPVSFIGNAIDVHTNNGSSVFNVAGSTGQVSCGGALTAANVTGTSFVSTGSTGLVSWTSRSKMSSPADGKIVFQNNGASGFTSLQFGGSTSSFPEIKVSGATFAFRLADDSADCAVSCASLTLSGIPKFGGTNTTGAGSALLATNCPAVTATAPYTWIQVTTSDGSTGYSPVWK